MAKIDGNTAMYNALYNYHYPEKYKDLSAVSVGRETMAQAAAGASAKADLLILGAKISDDSALGKMMKAVGDRMQDPTAVSEVIVKKWKQDPAILDKLQKDLAADPVAAQRLQDALVAKPEQAAATLQKYNGSNYAQVVASTTAPAVPAAAAPKPTTASAAAAAITLPASSQAPATPAPAGRSEKQPATPSAPAAAPSNIPPPPPLDMAALGKEEFLKFAEMNDDQIKAKVNPSLTKGLAVGIADYAVEKFGVEKSVADGFKDRINRDGKLRKAIEDNLKENPDFIRQLATTMKEDKALPDKARGAAKSEMTNLMENPEQLAKPDYLKSMGSQMQTMRTMNSGAGFLQNMFGLDMNGMMAGVGAWFNKIATWFNNVIQQFTGGNFLAMRNSGMGLFGAFGAAMNQASIDRDMNAMGLPQINYGMIKGKDGQVMHAEPRKDENGKVKMGDDGKPFMKQVPNTVEVTTINGEKHQVIPSAGLTIYRDQQGNFRVPVGTQMERGQITEMTTLVMNQKQFQEYEQKLRDPNGDFAYKGKFDMVYMEPTTVTSVDAKNGAVGAPQAQQAPTPQQQAPRVAQQVAPGMNEPRLEPEKASG